MKRSIEKIGYSRKLQGTIGLCVALAASGVAAGDRQPSSYDLALAERQAALQSTVENRADVIANLFNTWQRDAFQGSSQLLGALEQASAK